MKKHEKSILIAAGIGVFATLGMFLLKNLLDSKDVTTNYKSSKKKLDKNFDSEEHHGIEFFAML